MSPQTADLIAALQTAIETSGVDMTSILPDGSAFFVAEIDTSPEAMKAAAERDPISWNPWNKVVQDHRDGTIHHDLTNIERSKRNLPTPWTPRMADTEVHEPPVA